jgi:predicted ArsR family transcriptional regulator
MNILNEQEKAQLKFQHKQERDGRVRDRIKAVLLHDKGWSSQQIAEALLISDQAIRDQGLQSISKIKTQKWRI